MRTFALPDGPLRDGYLLIEPGNLDQETFAETLTMLSCTPATLCNADQLMPRLIDITALSPQQQEDVTQAMRREAHSEYPPVICAWLACASDSAALQRHIQRFLHGPGADGQPVLWRYYDPRVFPLVMHAFSAEQSQALLGPITNWRFVWCGRWWSVTGSGIEADRLDGQRPAWPDSRQWALLERSVLAREILTRCDATTTGVSDAACLNLLKQIDSALFKARQQWPIIAQHELADYAIHCIKYGNAFLYHEKLQAAWRELAQGKIDWNGLLARLDTSDYRQLNRAITGEHHGQIKV